MFLLPGGVLHACAASPSAWFAFIMASHRIPVKSGRPANHVRTIQVTCVCHLRQSSHLTHSHSTGLAPVVATTGQLQACTHSPPRIPPGSPRWSPQLVSYSRTSRTRTLPPGSPRWSPQLVSYSRSNARTHVFHRARPGGRHNWSATAAPHRTLASTGLAPVVATTGQLPATRTPHTRFHRARPGGRHNWSATSRTARTSRFHRARPGGRHNWSATGQLPSAPRTAFHRARPGGRHNWSATGQLPHPARHPCGRADPG